MDDILELVLDILFDGSLHAVGSKKVPLVIRVLLALLMAGAVLGISGLLIAAGLQSGEIAVTVMGIGILCITIGYVYHKWKKWSRK